MRFTDYDSIAERYDEDRRHWEIPIEESLEGIVRKSRSSIAVLDVGCGTGTWLSTNSSRLGSQGVSWCGIDPSQSMLTVAHEKVPFANLALARAEDIPLRDGSCAYVSVNFAFHHFADKERALDEIARVLTSGGFFSIHTPQPNEMRNQWVYRFFEGTWELDQSKFWAADQLLWALERRGFDVSTEWDIRKVKRSFSDILRRVELRVISELADIDDDAYDRGLEKIRRLASDPEAFYENESAMLRLEATLG